MRYDEFRDALVDALADAGYAVRPSSITETLDLRSTAREWKALLDFGPRRTDEPFYVSQRVGFAWSPVESARTYTTEDDLLHELFGGDEDLPETLPRHLRVDMVLHASLPWGSRTGMPSASHWRSWSCSVDERMADLLPTQAPMQGERPVIVMAWRGTVEVAACSADDGGLCMSAVSLPTWQAVVPPRIRDGSDDQVEGDIGRQLESLTKRYREALDEWAGCVAELGRVVRHPSHRE